MKITRRSALTLIGALPAGVSLWTHESSANAQSAHTRTPLAASASAQESVTHDRELSLKLSDRFRRQHWTYANQNYVESREDIVLYEGEVVRVRVLNDTSESQSLSLDDAHMVLDKGQTIALDLNVKELQMKVLRIAHSNTARTFVVRPSYQSHASIINA